MVKRNIHVVSRRTLAAALAVTLVTAGTFVPAAQTQAASAKAKKLTVSAASKTLYVGKYSPYATTKLKTKVAPSKVKQKVKYKSLTPKVAKVNASGKVTARKKGTAKIRVTTVAKNKKGKKLSRTVKIRVKKYTAPNAISAVISSNQLQAGSTAQITASLGGKPTDKTILYSSSDGKVATVSKAGLVTAVSAGQAVITVKSKVKGNKGKVLKKEFTVTVTGNTQDPGVSGTPLPTAEPTATTAPSVVETAEPTATVTAEPTALPTAEPTAKPTPRPKPTATPVPTPTPETTAVAEIVPVKISGLPQIETAQADIKPGDMVLNKKNDLSMTGSDEGMTISMTMTINKLNSSGNTFLWNVSGSSYPMAFQAVTPSGQLYTELDWRSQFYTSEGLIPIGEEFTLVTVYTDTEIRVYLNGELRAYYDARTGYTLGGAFTQGSLCPDNTTAYLATVRTSWSQYLLGVAPACINAGKTVTSGEVKDFAIYKKALQPPQESTAEKMIYPETAVYELSPDKEMVDFGATLLNASEDTKITYTISDTSVAGFTKEGKLWLINGGQTDIVARTSEGTEAVCRVTVNYSTIAIHDPSVFRDPISGYYYTVGSHCLAGYSRDMKSWSLVADSQYGYNNGNKLFAKPYQQEFKEVYDYVKPGVSSPEGLWAPSIIYSEEAVKYYMYVTIADGTAQGKCAIVLASADEPQGPYTYEKMIVASAMTEEDVDKTNLMDELAITDKSEIPAKYTSNDRSYPDCIDATVFYDHTRRLWMTYGSFTCAGGIRMIQLDPVTGDRLRSATYEDNGTDTVIGDKDPYYGIRLANANGEGPFIMEVPSEKSSTGYYYFLWTSVGGLQSYGGYHMRMFRSENVEGPYVDTAGNKATSSLGRAELGLRVMDNYKFSFMDYAFTSCGGNSAIRLTGSESAGDDKMFLHYHQKWANGTEDFVTKSNQMFLNEDGWLVTAPFAYDGETRDTTYTKEEVAGTYEFVLHRASYKKTGTTDYDYSASVVVELNEDGTITGKYTGTWTYKDGNITIKIGKDTYKGVVLEQTMEDRNRSQAMVFTAVGDGNIQSVWGCRVQKTDEEAAEYDASVISVGDNVKKDFELVTEGFFGSVISWTSDSDNIRIDGKNAWVTRSITDTRVKLTAVIRHGEVEKKKEFDVLVPALELVISTAVRGDYIDLPVEVDGNTVTWTSSDPQVIHADGTVIQPETESTIVHLTAEVAGVKLEYDVVVLPSQIKDYIYQNDYSSATDDKDGNDNKTGAGGWTSENAPQFATIENDAVHGKYFQFAPTGNNVNSRGAVTDFGVADKAAGIYTVEFDVSLKAGNNQTTEFALTGTDMAYTGNMNDGIAAGYIFKMSADNDTKWSVNGSEKVDIPAEWVHIQAVVDASGEVATVKISDAGKVYFDKAVRIDGAGILRGMYIRGGRYNSVTRVDNIRVY